MSQNIFVRVEYDQEFHGGDYTGVGNFVLLTLDSIHRHGGVEAAFVQKTGLSEQTMIHYSEDDIFDANGNAIIEPHDKSGQPAP